MSIMNKKAISDTFILVHIFENHRKKMSIKV